MRYPTRKEFRLFALVGIFLTVLGAILEFLRLPSPAPEINNALDWNYYGAIAPYELQLAYWWLVVPASIAGIIGFLFFARWSRKILVFACLFSFAAEPFIGLSVSLPLSNAVADLGGFIFCFPFVLSFFSPCNSYFGKQAPQAPANPDWSTVNVVEDIPNKTGSSYI